MKLVVAAVRPTPILWWRASELASPTEVPASTLPARGIAPVRAIIASRSVVLPLWKGPTSAMHRGPRGLLTSCPIAASSSGARPLIGSADGSSARPGILASGKNVAEECLARTPDQQRTAPGRATALPPRPKLQAFQPGPATRPHLAPHADGLQRDRIGQTAPSDI